MTYSKGSRTSLILCSFVWKALQLQPHRVLWCLSFEYCPMPPLSYSLFQSESGHCTQRVHVLKLMEKIIKLNHAHFHSVTDKMKCIITLPQLKQNKMLFWLNMAFTGITFHDFTHFIYSLAYLISDQDLIKNNETATLKCHRGWKYLFLLWITLQWKYLWKSYILKISILILNMAHKIQEDSNLWW